MDLPKNIKPLSICDGLIGSKNIMIYSWTASQFFSGFPIGNVITRKSVSDIDAENIEPDIVITYSPQLFQASIILSDIYGAKFAPHFFDVYHDLTRQQLEMRNIPGRIINRITSQISNLEKEALSECDVSVFVSKKDMERYDIPQNKMAKVIPIGCDYGIISEGDGESFQYRKDGENPSVVFHGSFDYTPNQEAAQFIQHHIAPELPDFNFYLAGRDSPQSECENIISLGHLEMEELANLLDFADYSVCPLFTGSGMKMKMLDYFSAGLPTITTSKGVEGIDVIDGTHCLIEDTASKFPSILKHLENNPKMGNQISENARKIGYEYSWENVSDEYDEVVGVI